MRNNNDVTAALFEVGRGAKCEGGFFKDKGSEDVVPPEVEQSQRLDFFVKYQRRMSHMQSRPKRGCNGDGNGCQKFDVFQSDNPRSLGSRLSPPMLPSRHLGIHVISPLGVMSVGYLPCVTYTKCEVRYIFHVIGSRREKCH
jgi:hypothetical protein